MAVETFGQHGANKLIYLVGLYCLVSVTLNGFAVPLPEKEWAIPRAVIHRRGSVRDFQSG